MNSISNEVTVSCEVDCKVEYHFYYEVVFSCEVDRLSLNAISNEVNCSIFL